MGYLTYKKIDYNGVFPVAITSLMSGLKRKEKKDMMIIFNHHLSLSHNYIFIYKFLKKREVLSDKSEASHMEGMTPTHVAFSTGCSDNKQNKGDASIPFGG